MQINFLNHRLNVANPGFHAPPQRVFLSLILSYSQSLSQSHEQSRYESAWPGQQDQAEEAGGRAKRLTAQEFLGKIKGLEMQASIGSPQPETNNANDKTARKGW